jgi:signal transduction histidine kinase
MLRSMRVRLMLAFVAVVAVAVGIAEVVAERTATREFDSYVSRTDIAYLETLAQNLGDYYAANGSWQDVESVFVALPQTPGHLQLQDSSGAIVGDTSPGRGPGGPGGADGSPYGPANTPTTPGPRGPGGAPGPGSPDTSPNADPSATPTFSPSGPGGSGEPVSTPTPSPFSGPAGPNAGPNATPAASPSGPGGSGKPVSTPTPSGLGGPAGPGGPNTVPDASPSAIPAASPSGPDGSGGSGGNEPAPGGGSPRSSEETGLSERTDAMVLADSAMAVGGRLAAEATPTPQATQRIPIYANGQQVGTLVVLSQQGTPATSAPLSDRFFDRVRLALLVGGVTALVVALILAVFLVDGITRPLRRLTEAARRVAAGDFSHRVNVTAPLEAAELAGSFNRMAASLERDQETRRRLLADITHELRTPLSVIQGTAQGFLDGVIQPDQDHAAVIRDEAELLSKLITDLRDLSLAEAGELRLERKPTDLGELARQAAAAVQHRTQKQGIGIEVVTPPDMPPCLVDSDRTLQMLGNLLDNALRHTPQGGHITLSIRGPEDGMLVVEVADTGEGIPPEHLPHIFERFYRVDASRERAGGTGLGLAIVSQLAQAQGGSVGADSEPGRGSVFWVRFPIAPTEAAVAP